MLQFSIFVPISGCSEKSGAKYSRYSVEKKNFNSFTFNTYFLLLKLLNGTQLIQTDTLQTECTIIYWKNVIPEENALQPH